MSANRYTNAIWLGCALSIVAVVVYAVCSILT